MYAKQIFHPLQDLTSATTNCPISRRFESRFNKVRFVGVCVDTYGMPRSLAPVCARRICVGVTSAARLIDQPLWNYRPSLWNRFTLRQRGKKMLARSSS